MKRGTRWIVIALALALSAVMAFVITRSITRPLAVLVQQPTKNPAAYDAYLLNEGSIAARGAAIVARATTVFTAGRRPRR